MNFKQVWKMLRDFDSWHFETYYNQERVVHRDGFFYWRCAHCVRLRRIEPPNQIVFESGIFEQLVIGLASVLLHRKLIRKLA